MRKAVSKKKGGFDTVKDRYLLATTADALADSRGCRGAYEQSLQAARVALDEYDAVMRKQTSLLAAGPEDPANETKEAKDGRAALAKVQRSAAGCATSAARVAVKMGRDDRAANLFRDASNRFAGVQDWIHAGEAALAAAERAEAAESAKGGGDKDAPHRAADLDAGEPGKAGNTKDFEQAAKILAIALDNPSTDKPLTGRDRAVTASLLAKALVGAGRAPDAVPHARAALVFLEQNKAQPRVRADAHELLADAFAGAENFLEAARCLEAAHAVAKAADDADWPRARIQAAQLIFNAGAAKSKLRDHEAAAAHFATARDAYAALGETKATETAASFLEEAERLAAEGLTAIDD